MKLSVTLQSSRSACINITMDRHYDSPYQCYTLYLHDLTAHSTEDVATIIPSLYHCRSVSHTVTDLQPGHQYQIILRNSGRQVPRPLPTVCFRAELTATELRCLLRRAEDFLSHGSRNFKPVNMMVRNKPLLYFEEIFYQHNYMMETYLKDNNGDPGSPINGQLEGLFFSASHEKTKRSPFGAIRLSLPATVMFNDCPQLYFADFYCNCRCQTPTMCDHQHYVTLVAAKPGSTADRFCHRKQLPRLSLLSNPFLVYRSSSGECEVSTGILVEVLYTEDIDLIQALSNGARLSKVLEIGTSSQTGIPKNPRCPICNLDSQ